MNQAVPFVADEVHPLAFEFQGLNVSHETILEQVAHNIRLGLPQAMPYEVNGEVVALVCGGPSLNDTVDELVEAAWLGAKVVAVNGAYQWCVDRNIPPSAMVMLDAREFNTRFLRTPVPDCHYLLASSCHPKAFDICRGRKVTLWHVLSGCEDEVKLLEDFYWKQIHPITMGTTIGLRAISLMRMLGFCRFEIFGLDSCHIEGKDHHAYPQGENDDEFKFAVWVKPEGRDDLAKRFICSPWMAKQSQDFIELVKERGDLFSVNVHGDGMIAHMVRTGAQLQEE